MLNESREHSYHRYVMSRLILRVPMSLYACDIDGLRVFAGSCGILRFRVSDWRPSYMEKKSSRRGNRRVKSEELHVTRYRPKMASANDVGKGTLG